MNFFATDETKKLKLKSGLELDVLTDISKRRFNSLVSSIPSNPDGNVTVAQASEFSAALFREFVVGWNIEREATVESYYDLKRTIAEQVDEALGAHFSEVAVNEKESRKS